MKTILNNAAIIFSCVTVLLFTPDRGGSALAQVPDTWTQKAGFGGTARNLAVGFSIGNKAYIGTGTAANGLTNDFWEWDQSTNIWTQKANFDGTARSGAVGFSIGTKGYIGTGADANG